MGITVLVTGGRFYTRGSHVSAWLNYIHHLAVIDAIVHGGASGVDTFADIWGHQNSIPCHCERPDYETYAPNIAPMIRNSIMLEKYKIDLGLVMPGGGGTADMHRKLLAANIECIHANHLTWPPIDQRSSSHSE